MIRKVSTTVDSIPRQNGLDLTKYFFIHNRRVSTGLTLSHFPGQYGAIP
jgi:hypothetical protein